MVARFVGSDRDAMFLAFAGGDAVGWLSVERDGDGAAEIGMGIVDGFRGRGIGSALMDVAVAWGEHRGVERLVLRVFPHNDRARALYRKFGFVELEHKVGVWPRRNGEFWDVLFMERVLEPRAPSP
jgi:RimJ/RimL family protein N-acetyltransferase